jgi:hypothetical protein
MTTSIVAKTSLPLERQLLHFKRRGEDPSDVAELYGVTTVNLNLRFVATQKTFPEDCMFELSRDEIFTIAKCRSKAMQRRLRPRGTDHNMHVGEKIQLPW